MHIKSFCKLSLELDHNDYLPKQTLPIENRRGEFDDGRDTKHESDVD